MQKISFGNKEYVRASAIAKKFRYTQDYVGQLCRNQKVDARLVGRVWYVEPNSVTEYRKTKHTTQKTQSAKVAFNKKPRVSNPKRVTPVIRSKTVKNTQRPATTKTVPVAYQKDGETMIPVVDSRTYSSKDSQTPTPKLEQQDGQHDGSVGVNKKLKIRISKKPKTTFASEKIPEISLSGKLEVSSLTDDDLELKHVASDLAVDPELPDGTENPEQSEKAAVMEPESDKTGGRQPQKGSEPVFDMNASNPVQVKPSGSQHSDNKKRSPKLAALVQIISAVVLGAVCAFCLISLASVVEVSGQIPESGLVFDFSILTDFIGL